MNQINFVAIIGAVFAGIISVVQVFHGSAITDLETGTVHKSTIQVGMANMTTWQKEQDRRIEQLEADHNLHIHLDDEGFNLEEVK